MKTYLLHHQDTALGSKFQLEISHGQITDPNFSWEEENVEFRYHGEYYDVISITKESNMIHLYGLKDQQENQLEQQLQRIHLQQKNTGDAPANHAVKFFPYFHSEQDHALRFIHSILCTNYPIWVESYMPLMPATILLPPPRCC